jgi:hypothetical protein
LHVPVAVIGFVGHYSAANFSVTSGVSGTVAIIDPTVVNGGNVDLSQLTFGAQSTLAHPDDAGGALTANDDRYALPMMLLRHYVAGSFVPPVAAPRHLNEAEPPPAVQLATTHRG